MTSPPPLRVLMLSYFYPPLGGAGVQRALKFSKYLPESGLVPAVVSADSHALARDESLLAEVPPGIEVVRLPHAPLLPRLAALVRRRTPAIRSAPTAAPESGGAGSSARWRDRALTIVQAFQVPDDKAGWSRQALRAARELIARRPVDLVFSTSPPVSAHLAALRLAREARVPWVADFRDLWTANPDYLASAVRRFVDRRLEDRMLRGADGIVTVSEGLAAALARRAAAGTPVLAIPNGYDEADFVEATSRPREPGRFSVVHAGTFYGQRSPQGVLDGIERLFEREPQARARLQLRLIGNMGSRFEPLLAAFAARHPGVLVRAGYVPHRQALAEVLGADVLLLVIGGDDESAAGVMTGKLFEYLRAARPILLVGAADGEAARLIRACGAGDAVAQGDAARVAELLARWMAGAAPQPDTGRAAAYERRALAGTLARFLRGVHERFHGRR